MSTSQSSVQPDANSNPIINLDGQSSGSSAQQASNAVMPSAERQAILAELERDGFTLLGLTGKPAALETMQVRISRGKVGLGKNAWEALGSPSAVLGLQRGSDKVLALIACSDEQPNALSVQWDATLELAFIRGASWVGALLGAGSKVTIIDVVFERNRLVVDAGRISGAAQQGQVKAGGKAGGAAREGVARGGAKTAAGKA